MILRTPPARKRRADSRPPEDSSPSESDRRLVIYEDPPVPDSTHDPTTSDHLLCTYQCRQMVKSEFFDALSSAEKQARDYQSKLETLNAELCKAEAERKKFRDQFLYAEQEIAAVKGREQMLQEQLLKEVNESQERLKKQMHLCSEVEVKHQSEMNLRRKAESLANSAEEKAKLLEEKLASLSQSSEREKVHLQSELIQMKRESQFSLSRINADFERMEFRARRAEKDADLLKEQLEEIRKQLNECKQQKNEAEKKLLSFSSQEISSSESNVLVKHLQEELRNYEAEVWEARKLKSSYENMEVLKEKLFEEKSRRERAESELVKFLEMEINMKKLEDELDLWKSLLKDIPGITCADDVPLKFSALQKETIESMMRLGEANARFKQVGVALDVAELGKQNAETEAKLAKEKENSLKSEVNQIEKMLSSVTEERDRLKTIIDELRSQKIAEQGLETISASLVHELELSLAKKDNYIKDLEGNLSEQKAVNDHQKSEIKLLNETLTNEAKRIRSLERESDRLRSEISLFETKLGLGDFSSANTKVLRMVNTLAVDNETKQTIDALQSELQKTKEKLQAVEEIKRQSGEAGALVDAEISGKIMQLKEQIATLEKREERYKTVFADRISVFRRACCELFGYKIAMDDQQRSNGIPVTHFTLQSIYAQGDDEKLEFEYESGNTNILANDYSRQPEISRQVDIFIRKLNSIPAFTANLTVESFNKRTLS